jgi:hypothetical protein
VKRDPLVLTELQLHTVRQMAEALPVGQRADFIERLGQRLSGSVSDAALNAAMSYALDNTTGEEPA